MTKPKTNSKSQRSKSSGKKATAGGKKPSRGRSRKTASRKTARHWGLRLASWSLVLTIWAGVILAGVVGWYAYDLPDVDSIEEMTRRPSIRLVSADGVQLASYGDFYGEPITVDQLPPHLPQAILAIEDRRFYSHFGIDLLGIARAMVRNVSAGRFVQGGSTITQQLAKNLFLSPDRTLKRKIQEALLAIRLEQRFTKDQILSLYMNRVFLGTGSFGFDAAARQYFGKPARDVTLYEAALLAGLLKAPSRYNPARDQARADSRTALVIGAMVDAGYISEAQARQSLQTKARGRPRAGRQARYFADWIMRQIEGYVGAVDDDLTIITTLNAHTQKVAEQELTALLEKQGAASAVEQGAVIVLSPNGAIRAMVGGRDYRSSQFNRATQALRQPGSAFKPFVFLAGLEQGMTPDTRMTDAPLRIKGWAPRNYGGRYYGDVTLREAMARSMNSVAVQVSERSGRENVAEVARRLGISSKLDTSASIALGTSEVTLLDLTGAYAAFANGGRGVWPYGIEEVRGRGGKLLFRRDGTGTGRVVARERLLMMNDMLSSVVSWGTGKAAQLDRRAAGKTGTSQDFRDAWFVGYTGELVAGVWFGNDSGAPMKKVTGSSLPAQLWQRVMTSALEGVTPQGVPGVGPATAPGDAIAAVERPGTLEAETSDAEESGGFIGRILKNLGVSGSGESQEPQRNWDPFRNDEDR
ncbi:transglycosylase domain-containing protein [Denitrobaculum tricleocarpae]|uniref:PBP1A family penicillin-binding protein n=1 Tax=Denitrobaculum tricleocarpae TaxID=2591009 RepID=A0A545TGG8_9PROT|nr:PBP1A family penicillin-binding protein [Denitrobaculum tricleocarpae]TQV76340.1 PBP1A family penicillin-binding protein [Denitrobaculum tricleocarpae]